MAVCMLMAFGSAPAFSQSTETEERVAPTVEVSASADASAGGLPEAYEGGQVAGGGRVGLFGNVDFMDSPFNSTNYTSELIQNQQSRTIADVLQNDPSVRVARGFGNVQELYMVRGFPLASDDMMYNGLYGVLPRQFIAAELVERVEVLRGANSFMNGATPGIGASGGAVNLVPKRAPNEPLSQVTVGVENGGEAYLATDLGRRFGPDGSSGLRLNAAVRNGDRSIDDEHRQLGVFAIGLDHRGENFRISADIGYQELKLDSPRPSVFPFLNTTVPNAPDGSKNFAQPWTYSIERDTFGTLRGEIDLSDDVVAWAAFGARKGSEDNLLSGPFLANNSGGTSEFVFANTREDTVTTGEVGIRGKFRTGSVGHTLAANLSAYSLDLKSAFASGFAGASSIYNPISLPQPVIPSDPNGGNLDSPRTTEETDLASLAIADTLSLFDERLLVSLGVRHQQIKDKTFNATTGAQITTQDDDAITPLLGIVYKATNQVSIYGNYVESLTKGPVAAQGSNPTPPSNVGEVFPSIKTKQKEIGAKYDSGSIAATLALFTTDLPLSLIENNVFSTGGKQRNRGAELMVFGSPMRGVRVLGGLTLLETEQVKTTVVANQGKEAIGVPDTQANIGGEWDIPGLERLTLTGRIIYTSTQFLDAANTMEVPSWTRYDIGARYLVDMGSQRVTLRATVENLTDEDYWVSAGGYPNSSYLVLGMPRTLMVSASLNF